MQATAAKLGDQIKRDKGLINSDITTDRTSGWFDMANFRHAIAHLQTGSVNSGQKATVAFEQATDSGGTSAKALGSATEKTAGSGGEELDLEKEINVTDLDTDNSFTHVRIKVTCDNSTAVIGSAVLIRDKGRF